MSRDTATTKQAPSRDGDQELEADLTVDERTDTAILKEDVKDNLHAAHLAAHSVRMSLTTGKSAVLEQDYNRLYTHVREVAAVMKPLTDKELAKGFSKEVAALAKEVKQLESELASNPTPAVTSRKKDLVRMITAIQEKTGAQ